MISCVVLKQPRLSGKNKVGGFLLSDHTQKQITGILKSKGHPTLKKQEKLCVNIWSCDKERLVFKLRKVMEEIAKENRSTDSII